MNPSAGLSTNGQALLDLLVAAIHGGKLNPERPETFPSYGEMLTALNLPPDAPKRATDGETLQENGMNDLAHWINQRRMPCITGLIVSRNEFLGNGERRPPNVPSTGYFKEYKRSVDDWTWWMKQVRASVAYDWSAYASPPAEFTPDDINGVEFFSEGKTTTATVKARERSGKLRDLARGHFANKDTGKLHCAICNWSAPALPLTSPIVEIHHLEELHRAPANGKTYTREEALKQVLPLCPTCHRVIHAKEGGGVFKITDVKPVLQPKAPITVPRG